MRKNNSLKIPFKLKRISYKVILRLSLKIGLVLQRRKLILYRSYYQLSNISNIHVTRVVFSAIPTAQISHTILINFASGDVGTQSRVTGDISA